MALARVERLNIGLSAGAVAASLALASPGFAVSLAAGAALEAMNLGAIHRGAQRFFEGEIEGAGPWVGLFAMRFTLLAIAIFVVLQLGAHPVALLIGLSLAMPAVVIDAWRNRPPVLDPASLPALAADDPEWERWDPWRAREIVPPAEREDMDELASSDTLEASNTVTAQTTTRSEERS